MMLVKNVGFLEKKKEKKKKKKKKKRKSIVLSPSFEESYFAWIFILNAETNICQCQFLIRNDINFTTQNWS